MKKYFKHFREFFIVPRIPYGIFLAGLLVMAVVTYGAIELGQFSQPPASLPTTHYAIGDTIGIGGIALKVESFREDAVGNPFLKPMAGYQFLMPTINITNHLTTNLQLIPLLYFYIKDAQGNVYHVTATPVDTDQLTGPILPGESVREEIGFEVPLTIDHPALYFERGTAGQPVVAIDLVER